MSGSRQHLATDEISIGDYVLGGGELAATVLMEAVSRLVPGVVGIGGVDRKRLVHHRAAPASPLHQARAIQRVGRTGYPIVRPPRRGLQVAAP